MRPPAGAGARRSAAPTSATHEKAVREKRRARRDGRYKLREVLWEHSTIRRVRWCGRCAARGQRADPGTPELRKADGAAYFAGVARCGSVWACPVCSANIRQTRAEEVEAAMGVWIAAGNQVLFMTLTLPHGLGDSCDELMATQKAAWHATFAGRPWRRTRAAYRVQHWFRTWDATRGVNGWHPHLHVALFVDGALDRSAVEQLAAELYERYAGAIDQRGHGRPSKGTWPSPGGRAQLGRTLTLPAESDGRGHWRPARARTDARGSEAGRRPHAVSNPR